MKLVVMHKVDARMEAGERPPAELIQKMGKLVGRSLKEGIFLDGAGLHRSATRARIVGGKVERGPYQGSNELLASFAMITAKSLDHAVELAHRLIAAGDSEIEIGPVVEGWDLTGSPRPADAPYRYLLLRKQPTGSGQSILDLWKGEGILLSAATLAPTPAARTKFDGGKRTWIDGPFAESKELVAGYSLLEVPAFADAMKFADEYSDILGDNEVDIRVVAS